MNLEGFSLLVSPKMVAGKMKETQIISNSWVGCNAGFSHCHQTERHDLHRMMDVLGLTG